MHRPTNKKTRERLAALSSAVLLASLAACGGSQKHGGNAPAPPEVKQGASGKINRTVTKEAKADFAQAVAYYQKQAEAGWTGSRCEEAADRFEEVASDHNKMVEARFNAGLSLQNCNKLKAAEEQYRKALSINRSHAPSLSNLGEIYFKRGNETTAKQYWESAVKADPKIAGARANLAWLIIREMREKKPRGAAFQRMHEQAAGHLSRVLAVENDNVEAYVLYALLYMEGSDRNKSRLALADVLLDKAQELNPDFPALHNARGLLLLHRDNVAQALASFRRAVQLDPKFTEAMMNVGNIVLDFRKYGEGEAAFKKVLELSPKSYDAYIGLGIAQRGQNKLDEAEASYNQARKIDGQRSDAYYNLGVLYQDFRANATQDLKKAQAAYRTAIKYFRQASSKPDASRSLKKEASANIGVCEKNIKSLDEAIKFQQQSPAGKAGG